QLYPFEEWQRIEEKLARLSNFNPTKKKFLNRTNYYGQVVDMDGQGRLLIPALLRDSAEIKGEVAVVANLTYLHVPRIDRYKKHIEGNAFTAENEKALDELGIYWATRMLDGTKLPRGGIANETLAMFEFFYKKRPIF